jgi:hypothetical protein
MEEGTCLHWIKFLGTQVDNVPRKLKVYSSAWVTMAMAIASVTLAGCVGGSVMFCGRGEGIPPSNNWCTIDGHAGKDLAYTFVPSTSEIDKQAFLAREARSLASVRCGGRELRLIDVQSTPFSWGTVSAISGNLVCADASTVMAKRSPFRSVDQTAPVISNPQLDDEPSISLDGAKKTCLELGFKPTTEKFGVCVLELSRRDSAKNTASDASSARGEGGADDRTCAQYGYRVGTSGYSDCRLQLDMARRDYERELRQYEAARADYERRVAEAEAEAQRARAQRQSQYGFCVAACSSQPGSTTLGCMSRCGYQSAGVNYDPGPAPSPPPRQTTYFINGQAIMCSSMGGGSVVMCN